MRAWLTPTILYIDRDGWGAQDLPRRGFTQTRNGTPIREVRTDCAFHHSAGAGDSDDTPNVWENVPEVIVKMRTYQTIRSNPGQPGDLGQDVPYNEVLFPMADRSIVVCEGRGRDRTSAATKGHNTIAHSICVPGNWHRWPTDFGLWEPAVSRYMGLLQEAIPGIIKIEGHRNYPNNSTLCPGKGILDALPQLTFDHGGEEEYMLKKILTFEGLSGFGRAAAEVYLAAFDHVTGGPPLTAAQINVIIAIGAALKKERDG